MDCSENSHTLLPADSLLQAHLDADQLPDEGFTDVVDDSEAIKSSVPRVRHADATAEQWQRWTIDRDPSAREELIKAYVEYAKIITAMTYSKRTHNEVEFEDYLQLAMIGLIESVDRYDPSVGVLFRTFSARRIHGAILNGLTKLTEKNQQIAVRRRLEKDRLDSLKTASGDKESGDPVATPAKSVEELFRYLAEVGLGVAIGVLLDGSGMINSEAFEGQGSMASPEVAYFRRTELDELRIAIKSSVALLTHQQQIVIRYHYLQEIPFEEIARLLGVTRGRISQIHKQALLRLKELVSSNIHCNFAL